MNAYLLSPCAGWKSEPAALPANYISARSPPGPTYWSSPGPQQAPPRSNLARSQPVPKMLPHHSSQNAPPHAPPRPAPPTPTHTHTHTHTQTRPARPAPPRPARPAPPRPAQDTLRFINTLIYEKIDAFSQRRTNQTLRIQIISVHCSKPFPHNFLFRSIFSR